MDLLRTMQKESGRTARHLAQGAKAPKRREGWRQENGACAMTAAVIACIQAAASEHDSAAARQCPDPELSLYRHHTIGLLRRYFRMSIELGRLPSVVGREFFRAKISSYRMTSFEDVVILVHDVDRCIARLGEFEQ